MDPENTANSETVNLPEPVTRGDMSLEEAIQQRRSIRGFAQHSMALKELSQLLWAAQGITDEGGRFRAAPSAGATYPLEIIAAVGDAEIIQPGIYRYEPAGHKLRLLHPGDHRDAVSAAALDQNWIGSAPVIFIISAIFERTTGRYGERGERYVMMEAGHTAQNLHLQAVALGYGSTPVGAFREADMRQALSLTGDEMPLYIVPVGKR